MGSGIAKQVREKYPWVYAHYKELCNNMKPHDLLGTTQEVYINEIQMIINIFAQENFGYDGKCYTDYNALKKGLRAIKRWANDKTIAIPYLMGCHRGGGDWNVVYKMIEEVFADFDGEVLICEYNGG